MFSDLFGFDSQNFEPKMALNNLSQVSKKWWDISESQAEKYPSTLFLKIPIKTKNYYVAKKQNVQTLRFDHILLRKTKKAF